MDKRVVIVLSGGCILSANLPESIANKIRASVLQDLEPAAVVLHAKLFLAVVGGGIVSLAICGQFGMGMTSWAEVVSHKLHEHMSPIACAVICGTIYAIFPSFVLRVLLCSPVQFRVILRRKYLALFSWYGGTGVSLAMYGQHGQGAIEILSWFLAAIATCYLLASAFKALIPNWDLLQSLKDQ